MNFENFAQMVGSRDAKLEKDLNTLKAICYINELSPDVEEALTNLVLSAFLAGEASFAKRANAMVDRACHDMGINLE